MMVVLVLMTNCHVSEKWKIGPVVAQMMIIDRASKKAQGEPTADEVLLANLRKNSFTPGAPTIPITPCHQYPPDKIGGGGYW